MPQFGHTRAFIGMIPIGKEDDKALRKRIDPNRSPGPASMPVGTERKNLSARTAVARVYIPTKSAPYWNRFRRLHRSHQADCFCFENTRAVKRALIQKHASITRQIGRREKQSSMTGDSPHMPGRRIVHHAA